MSFRSPADLQNDVSAYTDDQYCVSDLPLQVYDIPAGKKKGKLGSPRAQGLYDIPPTQDTRNQGVYDIPPPSQGVGCNQVSPVFCNGQCFKGFKRSPFKIDSVEKYLKSR